MGVLPIPQYQLRVQLPPCIFPPMDMGIHLNLLHRCLHIPLPLATYIQFVLGAASSSCQQLLCLLPFQCVALWHGSTDLLQYWGSVVFLMPLTFFICSQHHLSTEKHFHLPTIWYPDSPVSCFLLIITSFSASIPYCTTCFINSNP